MAVLVRYLTWCALVVAAYGALGMTSAFAAPPVPLTVDERTRELDLWPAARMRMDLGGQWSVDDVIAKPGEFSTPNSAYATLGMRPEVIWLRAPLSVNDGHSNDTRSTWIVDFEYTLLNHIKLYVVRDGKVQQTVSLGNAEPFAARPLLSRTHATPISLQPGDNEIYMRIESAGAKILPMRLSTTAAFHARAVDEQMLQGIFAAIGFGLLLYSLFQWVSLRENLYIKYAALVCCSTLFSVHFFGVGEQYFWTDNDWAERHLAGICSLLAAATAWFVDDALGADLTGKLKLVIRGVAAFLMGAAMAHGLDAIDIRGVGLIMGSVGILPSLLGVPGAVARMRRGDPMGIYFIAAWIGYFIASAIMVGVVKGYVGAGFWTMHSFQIGATFDMVIFMRIAVLRSAQAHAVAQRAARERDALHSLAHSDPLTGLLNRRGMNDALKSTLALASAERMLAVYVIDLDQFKPVNDQFGHDVGDELLVLAAHRLRAIVRSDDAVARFGGDEFVVMAGGLQSDVQARDLGRKILSAFETPFALNQHTCRVGATIGYALAPQDGDDAHGVLKRADAAMYAGKESGKNCIRRFETELAVAV